jgi:malate synthase
MQHVSGARVSAPEIAATARILTPEALAFVVDLQRRFNPERQRRLEARAARQLRLDDGEAPEFLPETRSVREGDWSVAPVTTADLQRRWVEITGPTDAKMVINALNCGADCFMADFEDANTPTWQNLVEGQANLIDAVEGTLSFSQADGRTYQLDDRPRATLLVRPRGWHLVEKHVEVDGEAMSGSLFDFGLYAFHNARRLLDRQTAPYFYLPKMESHLEARLWNEVFTYSESALGVPHGSIKATVLIETILAAFEMDDILYELREHSAGLNAGRWDYMFSAIKKFRNRGAAFLLPDRTQITMTVPFMRAYTELLVQTCHKRGAFAMGGMSAFIPNRRNAAINETALSSVRDDKAREAGDGFDGTWVAHPDLVPVAREVFAQRLHGQANQIGRQRSDVDVRSAELVDLHVPDGTITEAGVRTNVSVGIQYVEAWLRGTGAAAINNLMEDAATAEISRSQNWQWVHNGARTNAGTPITPDYVDGIIAEEVAKLREAYGGEQFDRMRFADAQNVFREVALADKFPEFLTIPAYALID